MKIPPVCSMTIPDREYPITATQTMHCFSWQSHQELHVPKMEGFLNLIFGFFGAMFFPYISRIHTAYIVEDSSILDT